MIEMESDQKHSDLAELGDLLELAERVQASYESSSRRVSLWRLAEAILLLASIAMFIYGGADTTAAPAVWVVGGFVLAIYAIAVDRLLVRRIRRRSQSDQQALWEVLSLLHELEGVAAAEDSWTALQRAEFRIRLSRFDLEEPQPKSAVRISVRRSDP